MSNVPTTRQKLSLATQDVATDGLSVRILDAEERGPGNGWQVGGYYLGQVLGGGVMLVAGTTLPRAESATERIAYAS